MQWCGTLLVGVFCLAACQVKRPGTVLPDAKMEAVLYDFHIAKAMGEELPYNEGYKRVLYIESVYRKHGIDQAVFDSSMVWFARHPDVLAKIYEKVNKRLKAERDEINYLVALRDNLPKESLPGDSVDVWIWQRIHCLTGMPLNNKLTFTLPADTNFKERDTLVWNVRFHFPAGVPDTLSMPLMAMQILYAKDTLSSMLKVEKAGTEKLALAADTLGPIKEIRGFIYCPVQEKGQTVLTDRMELMRYHAKDTLAVVANDTLANGIPGKDEEEIAKKEPVRLEPVSDSKQQEEKPARPARPRPQVRKNQ